ncbi:MAG: prepilin-type N-terminal cleavage/methylation domain-containing protein [Fibrobacterales bacterium]|nr:prepilin-type N-terminal cleavage/methylation domain-containing protein [Fibrobacterales bacterium]
MKNLNGQRGFTLVELAIYMVVASIAVTLAAHMWSMASVSNADTRKRAEINADMQDVLFFLDDDIGRIGAKTFLRDSSIHYDGWDNDESDSASWRTAQVRRDVYWDTAHVSAVSSEFKDSSSFDIVDNDSTDVLKFKSLVYDTAGRARWLDSVVYAIDAGSHKLVRRTWRWGFEDDSAHKARVARTVDSAIVVAENVYKFDVTAGVYLADSTGDTLLNARNPEWELSTGDEPAQLVIPSVSESHAQFQFSEATRHHGEYYVFQDSASGSHSLNTSKQLVRGHKYRIDFDMSVNTRMTMYMNRVAPGIAQSADEYQPDTLALLLAKGASGTLVGGVDTLYLFPADSNGNVRHYSFDFSPTETVGGSSARLRLYWALHSNLWESDSSVVVNIGQMPTMSIDRIVIRKIAGATYDQDAAPTVGEKKRSRSLDVTIGVRRPDLWRKGGEEYVKQDFHKIVRIPDNGPVR